MHSTKFGSAPGASLSVHPSPSKLARGGKQRASKPKDSRRAQWDDDDDIDPIDMLSSSQPSSPERPRRPSSQKSVSSRDHASFSQPSSSRHTNDVVPEKKKPKKPLNPYSSGMTTSRPAVNKSAPSESSARGSRPHKSSTVLDGFDTAAIDDFAVEETPKPRKKRIFGPTERAPPTEFGPLRELRNNSQERKRFEDIESTPLARNEPAKFPMAPRALKPVREDLQQSTPKEPAKFPLAPRAPRPIPAEVAPAATPANEPAPFPMASKSSNSSNPSRSTSASTSRMTSVVRRDSLDRRESFGLGPDNTPPRPELLRKEVAEFPLNIKANHPARRISTPPPRASPKRAADDQSPVSDRSAKRRKSGDHSVSLHIESSPETSRPRQKNADVDHSKLCPYCDELLPDQLSHVFKDLLRAASNRSLKKPRITNRHGLKAPLTVYIGVCERHRFEAKLLPQARKAGWPTTLDFDQVPARLMNNQAALRAILDNPRQSTFFCDAMDHIDKVGLRVAESAMGQYATFERIQPGYYGERGSVVIHQTMFTMFTPTIMTAAQPNFSPLTIQNFTHQVLVPEAALMLIMEDVGTGKSRDEALQIMRASSRFGALMFPDDEEDDNGVGDALMRERARKRRIEIEQEEAEEAALERQRNPTSASNALVTTGVLEISDSDASSTNAFKQKARKKTARTIKASTKSDSNVGSTNAPQTVLRLSRQTKTVASQRMHEMSDDDDDSDSFFNKAKATTRKPPPAPAPFSSSQPIDLTSDGEPDELALPKPHSRAMPPSSTDVDMTQSPPKRRTVVNTQFGTRALLSTDTEQPASKSRPSTGSRVPHLHRVSSSSSSSSSSGSSDDNMHHAVRQQLTHRSPPRKQASQQSSSQASVKVKPDGPAKTNQTSLLAWKKTKPVQQGQEPRALSRHHTRWDDAGNATHSDDEMRLMTPRPQQKTVRPLPSNNLPRPFVAGADEVWIVES